MSSRTSRIWLGSRPAVGSSRMSREGSEEGVGEPDALAVALGEVADHHLLDVLDPGLREGLRHGVAALLAGMSLSSARKRRYSPARISG